MKNIDVLDGKIEEVRNGSNPCSNANYDNGIAGSMLTNGHQVLEELDSMINEYGNKLSTEISRDGDEALAAKINKDGCHDPANSSKLTATASPDDSSSFCSNNGLPSGREDSNHVSGLPTTLGQDKNNKCENSIDSPKDTQMGSKLSTASGSVVSGEKIEELSGKVQGNSSTNNVSVLTQVGKLNGSWDSREVSNCASKYSKGEDEKSENVESLLSDEKINKNSSEMKISGPVVDSGKVESATSSGKDATLKEVGSPKMQESAKKSTFNDESDNQKTLPKLDVVDAKTAKEKKVEEAEHGTLNASLKITDKAVEKTKADCVTNKEQDNLEESGVKKKQESEKNSFFNSTSMVDGESTLKPDEKVETIASISTNNEQKEVSNQQYEKIFSNDNCEKSVVKNDLAVTVTKKEQDEYKETEIQVSCNKNSPNTIQEPIEKLILKSDVGVILTDASEEQDNSKEKLQEAVENILTVDKSMEIDDGFSLKSDEKEANSVKSKGKSQEAVEITSTVDKSMEIEDEFSLKSDEKEANSVESKEKSQEAVENISSFDKSMEIDDGFPLKSDEKEANTVLDYISLEKELEEQVENAFLQIDTSDEDEGVKVDEVEGKTTLVSESEGKELKKIDVPESEGKELKKIDKPESEEKELKKIDVLESEEKEFKKIDVLESDEKQLKKIDVPESEEKELKKIDVLESEEKELEKIDVLVSEKKESKKIDVLESDEKKLEKIDVLESDEKELKKIDVLESEEKEFKKIDVLESDEKQLKKIDVPESEEKELKKIDVLESEEKELKKIDVLVSEEKESKKIDVLESDEKELEKIDVLESDEKQLKKIDVPESEEKELKKIDVLESDEKELEKIDVLESDEKELKKIDVPESEEKELNKIDVLESEEKELKKIDVLESEVKELKKIDEPSMKTDELLEDTAEKSDIQDQSGNGAEKMEDPVSKKSNNDGEDGSQKERVTENLELMEVDEVENCEEVGKHEIGCLNEESSAKNSDKIEVSNEINEEPAAKEDSKLKLQDGGKESAVTPEASEGRHTLQESVKSSVRSDEPAESPSTEGPQVRQKRPAEFEEDDNLKRLKTDDSSTIVDKPKKRVSSSIDDSECIAEPKRKRIESGDKDKNFTDNSKSNVKSDSSEPEKSTNIDNSDVELEESTKLILDDSCESDVSLDLELKSDCSEPRTRTSSVSDASESKCIGDSSSSINKDELLEKILGRSSDSDDSNSASKGSNESARSTRVNSDSGSAIVIGEDTDSRSASLGTGEESSNTAVIKEILRRLKKSDLENLVILKMSENLSFKSEIGDLRRKYQSAKESIDRWVRRCHFFEKMESEAVVTLTKYRREIEAFKNEKGPEFVFKAPMKFTRSVGLQVVEPFLINNNNDNSNKKKYPDTTAQLQKSIQQQQHEQLLQQKYRQQLQLQEQQQKQQQQMHELQKQQHLKDQQQKALKEQESIQASLKPTTPKVTTNVRSSMPRRMVSSKPAPAASSSSQVQEVNIPRIVMTSPSIQKSPPRSVAPAAATSSSFTTVITTASSSSVSAPVPVAITASKMARTSPPKSLEVIDLTDKDEKSRGSPQATQKTTSSPASYTVVRQILPAGKQAIPNTANGQRAYLVPTSAVQGNTRQLLLATTTGLNQLPLGTTVVSATGRSNAVTLAANGAVVVKNGTVNNLLNIQRPVLSARVTQSATHPAPLPACPPAIHQNGWLLAPPRPQLVVRKTPNGAGIMLSWSLALNKGYEDIASYQLYAYQESTAPPSSTLWKKVGDVKALPLPMACTLTQFVEGHKYHFAVRAVDIHSRVGHFSGPSTITLN